MTGIVLAGGRATRFGRDKLLEPVGGEPLLWHPIRALASVCDEVLVATAAGRDYPLPRDVPIPTRAVLDERSDAGPLEGLRIALATATYPRALVAGGDMPSLAEGNLRRLIDAVRSGAAAASFGQPLPCGLDVAAARTTLHESSVSSLRAVLASLDVAALPLDDVAMLRDIDEPADLRPA